MRNSRCCIKQKLSTANVHHWSAKAVVIESAVRDLEDDEYQDFVEQLKKKCCRRRLICWMSKLCFIAHLTTGENGLKILHLLIFHWQLFWRSIHAFTSWIAFWRSCVWSPLLTLSEFPGTDTLVKLTFVAEFLKKCQDYSVFMFGLLIMYMT